MKLTKAQKEATARHHEKMARLFESVGRVKDAEAARRAARIVREEETS